MDCEETTILLVVVKTIGREFHCLLFCFGQSENQHVLISDVVRLLQGALHLFSALVGFR
jgi:hypothetical protein